MELNMNKDVKRFIMRDIIQRNCVRKNLDNIFNCSVLVLDQLGFRIISACCSMREVYNSGITLVENLSKTREPVDMDAIYFIAPHPNSVSALVNDFPLNGITKYKSAQVYFTHACPETLFKFLSKTLQIQKITSLKEIDIAFIPSESQVYSMDCREIFQLYYSSLVESSRFKQIENLAFQIASVCYLLNEYPSVRYIKKGVSKNNIELAQLVQQKLNLLKTKYPWMGADCGKQRSQLVIVDRSFDCISPTLHELTLQAMAYDNFKIRHNGYKFTDDNDYEREVVFDEKEEIWRDLRHQHIAVAVNLLSERLRRFLNSKRVLDATGGRALTGLSEIIKAIPEYKRRLIQHSTYMYILKTFMDFYRTHLHSICVFEQDLVMGKEAMKNKIEYDIKIKITSFLTNNNISTQNKIRLIILFILSVGGVPEHVFNELVQNAELSPDNIQAILNLNKLGITTITNVKNKILCPMKRKDHIDENTFQVSRWTPLIKDIMENCIENKLDPKQFPFISVKDPSFKKRSASSSKYTECNAMWYKGKNSTDHHVSRVIIFIVGGVSFSEIRCAYEVSKMFENWEIVIGSSHILTPGSFIRDLSNLGERK